MIFSLQALPIDPWWLVLLGLAIGVLSGLLGVGGGVLMTPALHILGMSMPVAIATTLTQMVGASLSGSIKHFRNNNVSLSLALVFGLPGMVGMHVGRLIMGVWSQFPHADDSLAWFYMGLMAYLAYSMLRKMIQKQSYDSSKPLQGWWSAGPQWHIKNREHPIPIIASTIIGFLVGILSSLTGLGGGFFYISAFIFLGGSSIKEAVGTSLAIVFLSSFYGAIVYGISGLSNIPVALFLMAGAIVGAHAGASLAHRSKNEGLQFLFVILIFAALGSMILKRLHWTTAAHILLFGSGLALIAIALFNVFRPKPKISS